MAYKSKSKMNQVVDVIQDMIKSNQDILKLISCDDSNVNIYELPNLSRTEASKVVKEKILTRPKEFSDNQQCCYMVLQYGNKGYHYGRNDYYNDNTFDVIILCHNDIVQNEFVGNRLLEIESILECMFDYAYIDKMHCRCMILNSIPAGIKNTDYSGRRITLAFVDKNDNMINRAVGR